MRSYYWRSFAVGALELGRAEEFLAARRRRSRRTPWVEAAAARSCGEDFARAAEVYGRIGALSPEAIARLRVAEQQLRRRGRGGSRGEQLERALAFWRSVGATAYLGERRRWQAAS